ncbi:MAG: PIN domain-containing protein [Verrucomicrobiota bacterium]
MILLDTNYLIGALVSGSEASDKILTWLERGEVLLTAMPAWYEFLCGPVSSVQIAAVRAILTAIVPLDEIQAQEAALLFNQAGRKRTLRVDALIAACAVLKDASLATQNISDFECFVPYGLQLCE